MLMQAATSVTTLCWPGPRFPQQALPSLSPGLSTLKLSLLVSFSPYDLSWWLPPLPLLDVVQAWERDAVVLGDFQLIVTLGNLDDTRDRNIIGRKE